jgi:hypothetical protein
MANYILNNTAADVNIAIGQVLNADATPIFNSSQLVTSGGVKVYVDTQIGPLETRISAIESELQNTSTGVSFERTAEFTTKSESYLTVPLSVSGQPDYFTNSGNNTFTILEGNYVMWFSFNWRTQFDNSAYANNLFLQLTTLNGMADFAGIGVFNGNRADYSSVNTTLLNAKFNNVNQTTTFALQIRDEVNGSAYSVYVKDVVFTILKV